MHIVEMAGIGTPGRSFIRKTASDIGAANLTKSQLGQFFSQLRTAGPIPYNAIRSNNLLKILGDDFPVASVIRFISHVRVTKEDLDVTLSTLRFTGNVARLKPIKIKRSIEYQKDHIVHRLRNEVDAVKKELTMNRLFLDQETSINMSKLRSEQINRSVVNYLNGSINDFTLVNATQAQQLLKSIKDFYNRLTVKETEIEQLKQKYESISKNMVDTSVSARLSKESALSADSRIRNRKRSMNSSGRLSEDQEAVTEVKEIEIEEVGSIAKTAGGMTLGPCKDTEDDKTLTIPEPVYQIDRQNRILKLRQLFERFLKSDKEYRKMKEMLDKNTRTLATVQQKFTKWINKYFEVKSTLENARDKLSKHQRIRHAMQPEDQQELTPKAEIIIERDIACHQRVLLNLEEEVVQAQDEIQRLFQEQREMRSQFNSGFKEYCKEMDASPLYSNSSMKLLFEPAEKASLEVAKRKFNQFQRAMTRKLQVDILNTPKRTILIVYYYGNFWAYKFVSFL
ncbi:uncharacterized protein LOC143219290 [Lasioglossum baleicum]|uniref:uncharacterized protein LOC143219290 n=1 Tax=Lasioglossum baleicum TaxID=434251 RepID=UPI003FCD8050